LIWAHLDVTAEKLLISARLVATISGGVRQLCGLDLGSYAKRICETEQCEHIGERALWSALVRGLWQGLRGWGARSRRGGRGAGLHKVCGGEGKKQRQGKKAEPLKAAARAVC